MVQSRSLYRDVIVHVYSDVIERWRVGRDAGPVPADAPSFQQALGVAVRERRDQLQITQEQLALRSGLHQRWISNVETGKRNPSYGSLKRLASGLDLAASDLVARAEAHETSP